jgi:hypothetical protein
MDEALAFSAIKQRKIAIRTRHKDFNFKTTAAGRKKKRGTLGCEEVED